tara:strand:- start:691 stop:1995 length:1305 start_codon:yes stop_codon:yes gene_type:complete
MKIVVMGLGYVGLTLALTLAEIGFQVIGIDKDLKKIASLRSGKTTLYEKKIEDVLQSVISSNKITFDEKIPEDDDEIVFMVCVSTPIDNKTHRPILDNLESVTKEIGNNIKKGELVVLRSTVPIGTTRNFILPILEKESGLNCPDDFHLVFAPERTLQGNALEELKELPQIIGGIDIKSTEVATTLFSKSTKRIVKVSSLEAAEVIKLFDNTYRDTTIAIGNLFGKICDSINLDSHEVIQAANNGYERNKILFPGAGVGGGCLVKDPYLLLASLDPSIDLTLISSTREINDSMINDTKKLIENSFQKTGKKIEESKILILGFAFKGFPATDDIRFSPTLPIVDFLKNNNAKLFGYDPNVKEESIENLGVSSLSSMFDENIDCVIIMNNNPSFKNIDFKQFKTNSSKPLLVIDGWYLYNSDMINDIDYFALGSNK